MLKNGSNANATKRGMEKRNRSMSSEGDAGLNRKRTSNHVNAPKGGRGDARQEYSKHPEVNDTIVAIKAAGKRPTKNVIAQRMGNGIEHFFENNLKAKGYHTSVALNTRVNEGDSVPELDGVKVEDGRIYLASVKNSASAQDASKDIKHMQTILKYLKNHDFKLKENPELEGKLRQLIASVESEGAFDQLIVGNVEQYNFDDTKEGQAANAAIDEFAREQLEILLQELNKGGNDDDLLKTVEDALAYASDLNDPDSIAKVKKLKRQNIALQAKISERLANDSMAEVGGKLRDIEQAANLKSKRGLGYVVQYSKAVASAQEQIWLMEKAAGREPSYAIIKDAQEELKKLYNKSDSELSDDEQPDEQKAGAHTKRVEITKQLVSLSAQAAKQQLSHLNPVEKEYRPLKEQLQASGEVLKEMYSRGFSEKEKKKLVFKL